MAQGCGRHRVSDSVHVAYLSDWSWFGTASRLSWLQELRRTDRRVYAKCVARIRLLAQLGHELRRPLADYLEDDIYELRIRSGRVNYRILYFLHGRDMAILAHALVKEDVIPRSDLVRAIERKRSFPEDPEKHIYAEDIPHG